MALAACESGGNRDDMHDAFHQLAHCMTLARKHPAF
jgi:hypothetical protein